MSDTGTYSVKLLKCAKWNDRSCQACERPFYEEEHYFHVKIISKKLKEEDIYNFYNTYLCSDCSSVFWGSDDEPV